MAMLLTTVPPPPRLEGEKFDSFVAQPTTKGQKNGKLTTEDKHGNNYMGPNDTFKTDEEYYLLWKGCKIVEKYGLLPNGVENL